MVRTMRRGIFSQIRYFSQKIAPKQRATMERDVIACLTPIIEPITKQSLTSLGCVQVRIARILF